MNNRQLFLSHLAQTSDFPLALEIEKAEGVYLYDTHGKQYLDLIAGIGVSNVGHRHPRVLAAMQEQLEKYMHLMVYGEYIQTPQVALAKAIADTLKFDDVEEAKQLNNIYLTNSGTEAIEGAMKLAKRYTGRQEIISCFDAYHGASQGALSLAGSERFKQHFRPLLPSIKHIRHGQIEDLEKISCRTAAVVIEVVSAEAGVRVPTNAYMQALRERCSYVGALLIFDEIQTGFGRTGKFWAFEHYGTYPDVLCCAKGMGGGMPIGAFVAPRELMSVFKNNPILGHITTFGGNPVCAAASLATLNVILEEHLTLEIEQKAALFKQLLVHPKIKEIRNLGLLMAVEFDDFDTLKPIIDRAIENGVITDWFLFCDNSMRIAPPLTISFDQIKMACSVILQAIDN